MIEAGSKLFLRLCFSNNKREGRSSPECPSRMMWEDKGFTSPRTGKSQSGAKIKPAKINSFSQSKRKRQGTP
jgi:hypothetical protein